MPRPGAFRAFARLVEQLPLPEPERQPGDDRPTLTHYERDGAVELHGSGFRDQRGVLIARFIAGGPTHYLLNSADNRDFVAAVQAHRKDTP